MSGEGLTYLLVDGENIDGALGGILGAKPLPHQRPRWQQVLEFARDVWEQPVRPLFFINATKGLPQSFVQALIALEYRPIPLAGSADEKVVDIGIQRTLDAILDRPGDVVLASHDADFVDHIVKLADDGRRVGVLAFDEMLSQSLRAITGVEIFDLEYDADAFDQQLPRVRILTLDEFDPNRFL